MVTSEPARAVPENVISFCCINGVFSTGALGITISSLSIVCVTSYSSVNLKVKR